MRITLKNEVFWQHDFINGMKKIGNTAFPDMKDMLQASTLVKALEKKNKYIQQFMKEKVFPRFKEGEGYNEEKLVAAQNRIGEQTFKVVACLNMQMVGVAKLSANELLAVSPLITDYQSQLKEECGEERNDEEDFSESDIFKEENQEESGEENNVQKING